MTIPNIATLDPDTYENCVWGDYPTKPSLKNQWKILGKVAFAKHPLWWIELTCALVSWTECFSHRHFMKWFDVWNESGSFVFAWYQPYSMNTHSFWWAEMELSNYWTIDDRLTYCCQSQLQFSHPNDSKRCFFFPPVDLRSPKIHLSKAAFEPTMVLPGRSSEADLQYVTYEISLL